MIEGSAPHTDTRAMALLSCGPSERANKRRRRKTGKGAWIRRNHSLRAHLKSNSSDPAPEVSAEEVSLGGREA